VAFDYVISLNLAGRAAVVVGGGEEAVGRVRELLHVGAEVTLISARPHDELRELAADGRVTFHERPYHHGDLAGAFLVIATREEPMDTDALWAEATAVGALTTVLDENEHCHFAQPALVKRGDLRIAVATAGRAPALAKRLRRRLEQELGEEYGALIDVLAEARAAAVPRTVSFPEWAARWERAMEDLDGLVALVREGRHDEARDRVLAHVLDDEPGRPPAPDAPGGDDEPHDPPLGQERA
jgi:precorrin-2 dehydrogenase / sirohydrochlorin ferrochelatase